MALLVSMTCVLSVSRRKIDEMETRMRDKLPLSNKFNLYVKLHSAKLSMETYSN